MHEALPGGLHRVFYFAYNAKPHVILMPGYIQLNRCETTEELLKQPECFLLLTQIALRARRTGEGWNPHNLEVGQALIGDYKSIGLSSEKVYRNAKKRLENYKIVAFKGTNKGTVATLLNSIVYDINEETKGEQKGDPRATQGRTEGDPGADGGRTKGEQRATKKNVKNGNNVKNDNNEKKINGNSPDLFPVEEKPPEVILPFESPEFSKSWAAWKNYKKSSLKFNYASAESEQAALMKLCEVSGGIEDKAIKIINNSMGNGWKGFFPLKDDVNGNGTNKAGTNGHSTGKFADNRSPEQRFSSINEKFGDWENRK
jgi:hypothetical protein